MVFTAKSQNDGIVYVVYVVYVFADSSLLFCFWIFRRGASRVRVCAHFSLLIFIYIFIYIYTRARSG